MTKAERISMIVDHLSREGYRPEIDEDGDVRFKVEGRTCFVIFDDDPTFFRLAFANFWPIENERERALVMEACSHASMTTKVVKVFTVNDNVWASVELFVAPPNAVLHVLQRSIAALQVGVHHFRSRMHSHIATA